MPIEIHHATPSDAPALAELFLSAFSDNFNVALFPRTPDVRDWWIAKFTEEITTTTTTSNTHPNVLVLKAIDTKNQNRDGDPAIVGFANWRLPGDEYRDDHTKEEENAWPPSCVPELLERFFGGMHAMRKKYMGYKEHYYLDILGTDPEYRGRGIASQLLQWGMSRADQEGMEIFLSASPLGTPLYEKYGFQTLETQDVFPGYMQTYFIRSPTH